MTARQVEAAARAQICPGANADIALAQYIARYHPLDLDISLQYHY